METDCIKPLYFPFTYISDRAVSYITACFGKVAVLRPTCSEVPQGMGSWVEKELLELGFPQGEDDGKINGIIAGYREWGSFNPGVRRDGYSASRGKVPFFDDDSTMGIRSAISLREKGGDTAPAVDTLLNARVFLAMADGFDLENLRIDQELSRVSMIEKELFGALKGEAELPGAEPAPGQDPGEYMPKERIEAWARLCRSVGEEKEARLLVTDSRAVEAHLLENVPLLTKVVTIEGISPLPEEAVPEVQEAIAKALAAEEVPDETRVTLTAESPGETLTLTVYRVPEGGFEDLFSGGAGLIGVVGY